MPFPLQIQHRWGTTLGRRSVYDIIDDFELFVFAVEDDQFYKDHVAISPRGPWGLSLTLSPCLLQFHCRLSMSNQRPDTSSTLGHPSCYQPNRVRHSTGVGIPAIACPCGIGQVTYHFMHHWPIDKNNVIKWCRRWLKNIQYVP